MKYADHDMFVIQGVTDLAKMREDCVRRATQDVYKDPVETSVIHHHKFTEDCKGLNNPEQRHEVFGELEEIHGS